MEQKTIRFYESLVSDIREGTKTKTIRYDWDDVPDEGSVMNGVSTQQGDIFADLEIISIENLSISECVDRDLEGHVDYGSVDEMISEMSRYYPSISKDDSVLLLSFKIVKWRR